MIFYPINLSENQWQAITKLTRTQETEAQPERNIHRNIIFTKNWLLVANATCRFCTMKYRILLLLSMKK